MCSLLITWRSLILRLEEHPLLDKVESLMKETKIIPADVAENPMPKSPSDDAEKCLPRLIQALGEAKEAAEATENDEKEASAKKSSSSYQGSRGPFRGRMIHHIQKTMP